MRIPMYKPMSETLLRQNRTTTKICKKNWFLSEVYSWASGGKGNPCTAMWSYSFDRARHGLQPGYNNERNKHKRARLIEPQTWPKSTFSSIWRCWWPRHRLDPTSRLMISHSFDSSDQGLQFGYNNIWSH